MGKVKGGIRKGAPWERKVARYLSEWWSWGESLDWFWRTESSGGRATQRAKDKNPELLKWSYGDITWRYEEGKPLIERFVIEAKRGHTDKINPLPLIDSPKNKEIPLRDWWKKTWKETTEAQRRSPMIIFRRDRCDACIMLPRHILSDIEMYSGTWDESLFSYEGLDGHNFIIINFFSFLQWTSPGDIIEAIPVKNSNKT